MSQAVFLDSGIFIALMVRNDQWHVQARSLFSGEKPRWSTSILVISETYSWFLQRMGEEGARRFRLTVDQLDGLRVFEATRSHLHEVAKTLDRFRGAKLTFVDASSLALIERHRIRHVWSTDHHLGLSGAEVLPRS